MFTQWYCTKIALQWRHNKRDSVSNHRHLDCLLSRLFRHRSKKSSKLHVTGLCERNHRWPMDSPHIGPVTRNTFPFDDVIMVQNVNLKGSPKNRPICLRLNELDFSWYHLGVERYQFIQPSNEVYGSVYLKFSYSIIHLASAVIFLSYPLIEWRWQNGERLEVITNVSFCLAANFCWQHLKSFKHNFGKGATFVIWGVQSVVHRWLITSGQKSCWTMFRITACRP